MSWEIVKALRAVEGLLADVDRRLGSVESKLADLSEAIRRQGATMSQLDDAISTLTAQVTQEDTVIDGAVTLINGIPGLIQTAVQNALAAGATAAQLKSLTDLAATIQAKSSDLANAVTANTPASQPPSTPSATTSPGG